MPRGEQRRCIGCGTRKAPRFRRLELEGIVSALVCEECGDFVAGSLIRIAELLRIGACAECSCTRSRCDELRRAEPPAPCCASCNHYERKD